MKRFWYKFLVCVLSLGMLYPTWIATGTQKVKAASEGSGGATTGGLVVNGETASVFPLNSLMITSNTAGDITSLGDVIISIANNDDVNLEFDTTANSVEAEVLPSGSSMTVTSPITPGANEIVVDVTADSGAGESLIVSNIKIKASALTPRDFNGTVSLAVETTGGMVYGEPIVVDTQKPEIVEAEVMDLSGNTQLDAVKITFSENIDDSTVSASDFNVVGYANETFLSTTNGDVANNNCIYLTFDELATVDTFSAPNVKYGSTLTDIAGNLMDAATVQSVNRIAPGSPANLTAVATNGEVLLSWDPVVDADYYNVYYQKTSDSAYTGPIAVVGTTTRITNLENGTSYRFIVRAVKSSVESADSWLEATPTAPEPVKVVLASAPSVQDAVVAQPETPVVTPEVTPPTEETGPEIGQIKGEETAATEEEDINWTPWIILFVLIVLAGAATGGYFYWFGNEEEEIVSEKVIEKTRKSNGKKSSGSKPSAKKSKRW